VPTNSLFLSIDIAMVFQVLKAKATKAASSPAAGPAMSAKQAMEIVAMRKAVDNRLDNTSHTCMCDPRCARW